MFSLQSFFLFLVSLFGSYFQTTSGGDVAVRGTNALVESHEDMHLMDATEGVRDDDSSVCSDNSSSYGKAGKGGGSSSGGGSSKGSGSSKHSNSSKGSSRGSHGSSKNSSKGSSKGSSKNSSKNSSKGSSKNSSKNSSKGSKSSKSSKNSSNSSKNSSNSSKSSKCRKEEECSRNPQENVRCLRPRATARFGYAALLNFKELADISRKGERATFKRLGFSKKVLATDKNSKRLNRRSGKYFVEVFKAEQKVKLTCVPEAQVKTVGPVCEGDKIAIACPKGQSINIVRASYASDGYSCYLQPFAGYDKNCLNRSEFTERAQSACGANSSKCVLKADDHLFPSGCAPSSTQSLKVSYQCIDSKSHGFSTRVPFRVISAGNPPSCKGKASCSLDLRCY